PRRTASANGLHTRRPYSNVDLPFAPHRFLRLRRTRASGGTSSPPPYPARVLAPGPGGKTEAAARYTCRRAWEGRLSGNRAPSTVPPEALPQRLQGHLGLPADRQQAVHFLLHVGQLSVAEPLNRRLA